MKQFRYRARFTDSIESGGKNYDYYRLERQVWWIFWDVIRYSVLEEHLSAEIISDAKSLVTTRVKPKNKYLVAHVGKDGTVVVTVE